MKLDKIQSFIDLAKENNVSELRYEGSREKYYVSFLENTSVIEKTSFKKNTEAPSSFSPIEESDKNLEKIKSPFVGTFYTSPSPDKSPYVQKGDRIAKGKSLCIIEAMKIMNEIEAEFSGEIVDICVQNGSFVEFNQDLFIVKKD